MAAIEARSIASCRSACSPIRNWLAWAATRPKRQNRISRRETADSECAPNRHDCGTRGFMKMLIGKENDEIVCFTASGIEASELMAAVHTRWLDDCRIPRWAMRSSRTRQCLRGWSFFWDRSRNATPNRPRIACRPAKSCSVLRETPFPSNTKGTIQMAEVHQFPSTGSHEEVTPARRDMTL
jgi:hypothetical protein